MRRRPQFTIRFSLAVVLTAGLFALALAPGGKWRPHEIDLGPRLGYLYWFDMNSIGLQRHVWTGPPKPIVVTFGAQQSAGARMLGAPRDFWFVHHSTWEQGLIDRSFSPERFTPVGHITAEWWAPSWPLFFLLSLACGYYFARWLPNLMEFRRRMKRGLCPICSYDLRAHKPGDKCPECGTRIAGGQAK